MYKLLNTAFGMYVIRTDQNLKTTFPMDETNNDYQAYLAWLKAGNTPEEVTQ